MAEVTIEQALDKVVKTEAEADEVIAGLDEELNQIQATIDMSPDLPATADRLKAKRKRLLEILELHEANRDEIQFNKHHLIQISLAKKTLELAQMTQDVIKSATTSIKETIGTFNLPEIEAKNKEMENLFTDIFNLGHSLVGGIGISQEEIDASVEEALRDARSKKKEKKKNPQQQWKLNVIVSTFLCKKTLKSISIKQNFEKLM